MSKLEKAVEEALRRKNELVRNDGGVAAVSAEVDTGKAADALNQPISYEKPAQAETISIGTMEEAATDKSPDHVLLTHDTNFAATEVYGKIKSRILRMSERTPELRRIMVTSTLKGEGKSLTAANLAISFSRSYDQSVLLIDTDLRAPSVHNYLGTRKTPGLIQCLTGEASIDEAIIETEVPNLNVLPAGGTVANPVELLASARNQKIINEISRTYRNSTILFDAPPILPFADAHALLPNIGGVIFVIREGFARKDQFEEALQSLDEAGFVGIVFNAATRNTKWKASEGYGYGYGY
jgi:exopolysaccharide/PEP-CTERM locus tyrosine autokinase